MRKFKWCCTFPHWLLYFLQFSTYFYFTANSHKMAVTPISNPSTIEPCKTLDESSQSSHSNMQTCQLLPLPRSNSLHALTPEGYVAPIADLTPGQVWDIDFRNKMSFPHYKAVFRKNYSYCHWLSQFSRWTVFLRRRKEIAIRNSDSKLLFSESNDLAKGLITADYYIIDENTDRTLQELRTNRDGIPFQSRLAFLHH